MLSPFFLCLFCIFPFITSLEEAKIDDEYFHFAAKKLKMPYNSNIPFSIHLTVAAGNANMWGIFIDEALSQPTDFILKKNERKFVLTATNPIPGETYYFEFRCAACGYFGQIRQENQTNIIQLSKRISNYEFLTPNITTTFLLPKSTATYDYMSTVFVSASNCEFNLIDPNNKVSNAQTFVKFSYPALVDKDAEHLPLKMSVAKMFNPLDTECRVLFDISYYDSTYKTILYEIPSRSYHKFVFDDPSTSIKFMTSVNAPGKYIYPYFDVHNEGLFEYGCEEQQYNMHPSATGSLTTFITLRSNNYQCRMAPLLADTHFANISVVLREGTADYPVYFPINKYIRDYVGFQMDKLYYTLIYDFVGKFVIYNPREKAKNCIRIREPTEKDDGAYYMLYINPDHTCQKASFIEEGYNAINTIVITKEHTEKCKEIECELHLTIELNVQGPSNEKDSTKRSHQRGYHEGMLFYMQQPGEVTQAYFSDPIFGSFVSDNDTTPMYYRVSVPFQIKSILINFERYKDNIELYIKKGYDKPTQETYDWKITQHYETDIVIHYNDTDNDNEFGSFQDEVFTLMLLPKQYVPNKSEFKVLFVPQYPFSPVQTVFTKLGESNSCNIDNNDNLYCVFMFFLNEHTSLQGWSFYIDFPYDHSLQAESIYIRTLTYDTLWPNVFTYSENNIDRLFPDDTTSHTVKLERGESVYYTPTDSLEELKLVLVRVNVPRPAKVKIYTAKYFNRTKVPLAYVLGKQYYYTKPGINVTMNVLLEKGVVVEWKKVFPKSGKMQIGYDNNEVNVVYQDDNCIRFVNDGMNDKVIDINIINQTNEVSYFLSRYEAKEIQPQFMEFKGINTLEFGTEINSKRIINVLPKGKSINIHLYSQLIENSVAQRSSSSIKPCDLLNINAYKLSTTEYYLLMENSSYIPPTETIINIECSSNDNYGFLHFNSSSDDVNYLYISLERKPTTQTAFKLLIMKQENNETPNYFVSTVQPIQGIVTKNETLSEMNLPVFMTYILNAPEHQSFIIEITSSNVINIKHHLSYYNISTYSNTLPKKNESWYIEYNEYSSKVMKLHVIRNHPSQMEIVLGFMFNELNEVVYEMKLIPKEEETDVSFLIPIGVTVVCVIVLVVVFTIAKRKKKKYYQSLIENPFSRNSDAPSSATLKGTPDNDYTPDNDDTPEKNKTTDKDKDPLIDDDDYMNNENIMVEKPVESNKDLYQWEG